MMKIYPKKKLISLFLSILSMLIIISLFTLNQSCLSNLKIDKEIINTVSVFRQSIIKKDYSLFLSLLKDNNLIIIRNFVTGGNGIRGTNFRMFVHSDRISKDFSINAIKGEEGFILEQMFFQSIKLNIQNYLYYQLLDDSFELKDNGVIRGTPPTSEIIDKCLKIRKIKYQEIEKPVIIVLGNNEFVLTESSIYMDLPIGTWAIFKKFDKKYFLIALFDFR